MTRAIDKPTKTPASATVSCTDNIVGTLEVPGDKSISHRVAIFSALAEGTSTVIGFLQSEDCVNTLRALEDALLTYKSNTALIENNRAREQARYAYTELRREALGVCSDLQAHGFEAGDRAAVLMGNQSKWIINALGALWAGAVLVPLDAVLDGVDEVAVVPRGGLLADAVHLLEELELGVVKLAHVRPPSRCSCA